MEFFIIRIILLIQFYCKYGVEGNNFIMIGFILMSLLLYLINLNWSKYKKILIVEGIIALIIGWQYPLGGIIFSLAVIELLNNKGNKIAYTIAYLPLVSCNSFEKALELATLISIINVFSFIILRDRRLKAEVFEERDSLKEKLYNSEKALDKEKESRELQLYNLQLEERNKLSGKMHDKIGHVISTSLMQLRASIVIIDKDISIGKDMINSSINILNNGMEDIRSTLKEIKPVVGDVGINKIKVLLEEKLKYSRFTYSFTYKGELEKITIGQWTIFIDATRELTTNILKYCAGNKFHISLEVLKGIIRFSIKDNGEGDEKLQKGMGLISMEEKIMSQNGNFIVNNEDGFEVIITMSIEERE